MTHFDHMLRDPASHYAKPQLVLEDTELTQDEKRLVLQEWEQDALGKARSDEENMHEDQPNMLSRIRRALSGLEDSDKT